MSKLSLPPGYAVLLKDIKDRIAQAQARAVLSANAELVVTAFGGNASFGGDVTVRGTALNGGGSKDADVNRVRLDIGAAGMTSAAT